MKKFISRAFSRANMSAMKKLFLLTAMLLFTVCTTAGLPLVAANAEESPLYAVADGKDVWFYAEENEESGLFVIPYTYYVLVLRYGETFCSVQYLEDSSPYRAVTGYCKTADLTFVDFIPARPYLRYEFTVTYTLANTSFVTMGNGSFNTVSKTFVYYGTSCFGTARFHYVYSDGIFDYIPASEEIVYDLNTDYLSVGAAEPVDPPIEEPAASSTPSALQIAVVCLTVAAVAAIGFFVLHGKKASVPQEAEF